MSDTSTDDLIRTTVMAMLAVDSRITTVNSVEIKHEKESHKGIYVSISVESSADITEPTISVTDAEEVIRNLSSWGED